MGSTLISYPQIVFRQAEAPAAAAGRFWIDSDTNDIYYCGDGSNFTKLNVQLGDLNAPILENSLGILEIFAADTLTAASSANMVRDIFSDSTGYVDTVNTGNTTATYNATDDQYEHHSGEVLLYALDESSGTAADNTGSGGATYDGTFAVTPTWEAGKLSNCFTGTSTNAEDQVLETGYTIDETKDFSLAFWFNSDEQIGNYLCGTLNVSTGTEGFGLINDNDNNTIELNTFSSGSSEGKTAANTTINTGTWYHVVLCYDASEGKWYLYINGSIESNINGLEQTLAGNDADLHIGADSSGHYNTEGSYDDVRLWERVLTAAEVTSLYNSGSGTTSGIGSASAVIVETDAQSLGSTPTNFQVYGYKATGDTAPTIDISFDGGSNYQTGVALDTATEITDTGSSMILKINLSDNAAVKGYGVLIW
jgi:hypothetical protein